MTEILQKDADVLREIAKPVEKEMFGTSKLKKIIDDMSKALASQSDGVALAAPQIGVSLRMFIVSGTVFELIDPDNKHNETESGSETETKPDLVFINPSIVTLSQEKEIMEEGCLSVRPLYGNTKRSKKARVRAQDINGKAFELGGSGLLAQIFQHEYDHLDGILFIDHATDLHDMPPPVKK